MQLSVVILNYNVRFFLELCLRSVLKATKNLEAEIIVVDNASTDESAMMMRELFPEIEYVYNDENTGFPRGNNTGVARASGEYVCILNPDTVVGETVFEELMAFSQQQVQLGIVGCRLVDGSGAFLPESKRGVPTPWVAFTKVSGLHRFFSSSRWFNQYYAGHLKPSETGAVDVLVGAFMWMKRSLYEELGGFDEGCFMYADDIDLSYRAKLLGRVNYYCSSAAVIHYKGESTHKDELYMNRFKEAMQFFYKKHFKPSWAFDVLMQMGVSYFALVKKNEKVNSSPEPHKYVLISTVQDLKVLVEQQINRPVEQRATVAQAQEFIGENANLPIELLFDASSLSYSEIIQTMVRIDSPLVSFKIRPEGADFFLGSNNSQARGEIMQFEPVIF